MNNLTPSKNCYDLIKKYEGCELKAYRCPAGILTIGVGHTVGVTEGMTCNQAFADACLEQDVGLAAAAVNQLVTVPINQNQFDALVSFTFNLGAGNLGKSTLLKTLNNGAYTEAANQFKRWNLAGGKVSKGLIARRNAEQELFSTPQYLQKAKE